MLRATDFAGLWTSNAIELGQSCTAPSAFCTLDVFTFVNRQNPVTLDLPSGLASIENGTVDFTCTTAGATLTSDYDCASLGPAGDGVVLFHIINESAMQSEVKTVSVEQAAVVQDFDVHITGPDTDRDGMPDAYEQAHVCMDPSANDAAADGDSDGLSNIAEFVATSDPCVADTDGDNVNDGADNCLFTPNADQLNTDNAPLSTPGVIPIDTTIADGDRLGDACDPDWDNDMIPNGFEPTIMATSPPGCLYASGNTDPLRKDTDGDGASDGAECYLGSDPASPLSKPPGYVFDADMDGLNDTFEEMMGWDQMNPDTDGDHIPDGVEYKGYNTSPALADTDGDGCSDGREIASVNDDKKVNSTDMLLVAKSFGRLDRPVMDVSKDGKVDSTDMLIVAQNFASWPC